MLTVLTKLPTFTPVQVLGQLLDLEIQRGPRTLDTDASQGLIPPPEESGGGRGKLKRFSPLTACEIFANEFLREHRHATSERLKKIRELALQVESFKPNALNRDELAGKRELLQKFRNKFFEAVLVSDWLKKKFEAIEKIYGKELRRREAQVRARLQPTVRNGDADLSEFEAFEEYRRTVEFFRGPVVGFLLELAGTEIKEGEGTK